MPCVCVCVCVWDLPEWPVMESLSEALRHVVLLFVIFSCRPRAWACKILLIKTPTLLVPLQLWAWGFSCGAQIERLIVFLILLFIAAVYHMVYDFLEFSGLLLFWMTTFTRPRFWKCITSSPLNWATLCYSLSVFFYLSRHFLSHHRNDSLLFHTQHSGRQNNTIVFTSSVLLFPKLSVLSWPKPFLERVCLKQRPHVVPLSWLLPLQRGIEKISLQKTDR